DGRRRLAPLPPTAFVPGQYWVGRRPGAVLAVRADAAHGAASSGGAASAATDCSTRRQDPARSDAEQTLLDAWSELLGIDADDLGPTSNFISLGGNSLLATRLINLLKRRTGAELPVQALFEAPRLADMAAELERRTPLGSIGALDVKAIVEGITLVEAMSDAELDALDIAK
ncbi:acyl carrier protein, partial [Streptomyces sp. NPDC005904]